MVKVFLLLYADDIVIFSNTVEEMQSGHTVRILQEMEVVYKCTQDKSNIF